MSELPQEPVPGGPPGGGPARPLPEVVLTPLGQQHLDQTQPWLRFMSILMFIGAGITAVSGLMILILTTGAGLLAARAGRAALPFGTIGGLATGLFYIALACLYLAPSIYLYRYASAIRQLKNFGNSAGLEEALKQQRSFWRYIGIISIIAIVAAIIVIAFAILAGIMGAMIGRR